MNSRIEDSRCWITPIKASLHEGVTYSNNKHLHHALRTFTAAIKKADIYFKEMSQFDTIYSTQEMRILIAYKRDQLSDIVSQLYSERGKIYLQLGNDTDAKYDLKEATRLNHCNAQNLFYRAIFYLNQKNHPKALLYFCQALDRNPELEPLASDFVKLLHNNSTRQIKQWINELSMFNKEWMLAHSQEPDNLLSRRLLSHTGNRMMKNIDMLGRDRFFRPNRIHRSVTSTTVNIDHTKQISDDKGKDKKEYSYQISF